MVRLFIAVASEDKSARRPPAAYPTVNLRTAAVPSHQPKDAGKKGNFGRGKIAFLPKEKTETHNIRQRQILV